MLRRPFCPFLVCRPADRPDVFPEVDRQLRHLEEDLRLFLLKVVRQPVLPEEDHPEHCQKAGLRLLKEQGSYSEAELKVLMNVYTVQTALKE